MGQQVWNRCPGWESSPKSGVNMQISELARGVTCLYGFHQALLWVPEQPNFLVLCYWQVSIALLGFLLLRLEGIRCPWQFCSNTQHGAGQQIEQTNSAPCFELGVHRPKANAIDVRTQPPSVLDIFISSALLAEPLKLVLPTLTASRSW